MTAFQIKRLLRLAFSTTLFIWCIGFFLFMYNVKNITHNDRYTTETIVTIGGKKQNLYSGVQLLKFGYAPIVFVTGNKPKEDYTAFFKQNHLVPEQFIFDTSITGNENNDAIDVATFLRIYRFHSKRIVASADQMPRLIRDIKSRVDSDVVIIPHPISIKNKNYSKLFVEYTKYTLTLVFSFLGMNDSLDLSYS